MPISVSVTATDAELAKAGELMAMLQSFAEVTVSTAGAATLREQIKAAIKHQNAVEFCRVWEKSGGQKDRFAIAADAIRECVLDPSVTKIESYSAVPYLRPLESIPPTDARAIADCIVKELLRVLQHQRPIHCLRVTFFPHAEVFASLVHLQLYPLHESVSMVTQVMIPMAGTRSAGVTLLGKIVQHCLSRLPSCGDAVQQIKGIIPHLQNEVFQYDAQYITENLLQCHRRQVVPQQRQQQQQPKQQQDDHLDASSNQIPPLSPVDDLPVATTPAAVLLVTANDVVADTRSITHDVQNELVFAGLQSGEVKGFSHKTGEVKVTVSLENHFSCSMDCLGGQLMAAAVPKEPGAFSHAIISIDSVTEQTHVHNTDRNLVALRMLKPGWCLAVEGGEEGDAVTEFDFNEKEGQDTNNKGKSWKGSAPITALDILGIEEDESGVPNVFVTAGGDKTLRFWDRRKEAEIGCVTLKEAIVAVASRGNKIACCTADNEVAVWEVTYSSSTPFSSSLIGGLRVPGDKVQKLVLLPNALLMACTNKLLQVGMEDISYRNLCVAYDKGYQQLVFSPSTGQVFAAGRTDLSIFEVPA